MEEYYSSRYYQENKVEDVIINVLGEEVKELRYEIEELRKLLSHQNEQIKFLKKTP